MIRRPQLPLVLIALSAACLLTIVPTQRWAVAGAAPASPGKRVALLVGVNKYEKRGLRDLEFAERDVTELAVELRKSGYEIHLLTGSGAGDSRATLENIKRAVSRALGGRTKQDLVLVGLAGHGLQLEVEENKQLHADSFYCPVDAVRSDAQTLLSMDWLFEQIDQRGGGQNVVLVDACREDPARGRGLDGSKVQNLPRGVAVMFGCDAGQKSFETSKAGGGHGVYFHFVLEGLRGKAANKEGNITWNGLTEYVQDHVTDEAPKLLDNQQLLQTPNAFGNLSGKSLVLARMEPGFAAPQSAELRSVRSGRKAGEQWDENGMKLPFCWCPPGTFKMGSPASDKEALEDEKPVVDVTLTNGFWLGKHEITQAQWYLVMETSPWQGKSFIKAGSNFPASYVSWEDAVKFCQRLTATERKAGWLSAQEEYRLPTEAEWEYACRSGRATRYSFGDDAGKLNEHAWQGGLLGNGNVKFEQYAHQVGLKQANAWGLHDMHANVWEWCSDIYGNKLLGGRDPQGFATGAKRVARSGGWNRWAANCRSAVRSGSAPDFRYYDLGFRVALSPAGK